MLQSMGLQRVRQNSASGYNNKIQSDFKNRTSQSILENSIRNETRMTRLQSVQVGRHLEDSVPHWDGDLDTVEHVSERLLPRWVGVS